MRKLMGLSVIVVVAVAVMLARDWAGASIPAADYTLQDPIPELYSYFGRSVATGDVNGDGIDDAIVGASGANAGAALFAGQVFVFLGGQPFDPAADFVLEDPVPDDDGRFGWAVGAGDVNGDGKDDVIVGAPRSDAGGGDPREGQVFVFLGGDPFAATADFTLQDPSPITGLDGSFGGAVTAGDVNGDGKDDVVVGAPGYTSEAFVFLGGSPFDAVADFTLQHPGGHMASDGFGGAVAAGDLNGDLKDDVIVGDEYSDEGLPSYAGQAFVFLGGDPFDAASDFTLQDPTPEAFAEFGWAVGAADLTGDGKAEVVVGAPWSDVGPVADGGEAFVFLGGDPFDAASDFTLLDPTPSQLGRFGKSLAAGDMDGDGKKDLTVGADLSAPSNGGEAFTFLGSASFDTTADATLQDPSPEYGARFDYSVAGGDVNGDGFDDVLVGADMSDVGDQEDAGEAFVFLGKPLPWPTVTQSPTPSLPVCPPSIGFGETIQCSITTAGEVDGYTFTASAGDVVLVRMTATSGNLWPEVRLYAPGGGKLCEEYGPTTAEIGECALPSDGTYTILADDGFNGTYTGDYRLYLQRLNNAGNCTPIGFGDTLPGTIGTPVEMDAYCFDAAADDVVLVRMSWVSGDLWPEVRLYAPHGSKLCEDYDPTTAEIGECALPSDGTYLILAGDGFNGTFTGDYNVTLQCLTPPCGGPVSTETPTPTATRTPTPTAWGTVTVTPTPTVTPTSTATPTPYVGETTVRIGSGSVAPGGQLTVPLEALDVPSPGLGAFIIDISYDPSVVDPVDCNANPEGDLDLGFCNFDFERDDVNPDTIRVGGFRASEGATGDLSLADITFRGVGSTGSQSPLTLTIVEFADTSQQPIPATTEDGTITVGVQGDANGNGSVTMVDAMLIAQCVVGLIDCGGIDQNMADVNCSGSVSMVDAMLVAQKVVGLIPEFPCGSP